MLAGLELPGLVAAIPIGVAALVKAMLYGKEFANGKSNGKGDAAIGYRESDRSAVNQAIRDASRERALLIEGLVNMRSDTKEQTKVLQGMRDDLRDLCNAFRSNLPRN